MNDDEIAERIAKRIGGLVGDFANTPYVAAFLDHAEAYHLAFVDDVRERAKVRRQAKRVRRLVFAKLGVSDRAVIEK